MHSDIDSYRNPLKRVRAFKSKCAPKTPSGTHSALAASSSSQARKRHSPKFEEDYRVSFRAYGQFQETIFFAHARIRLGPPPLSPRQLWTFTHDQPTKKMLRQLGELQADWHFRNQICNRTEEELHDDD